MEELSKKASLPTLHDLAPGSVFNPLAKSQPEFTPDAIDNEITSEPNQKWERMGSSSTRSTTIIWTESGSFDDVVS